MKILVDEMPYSPIDCPYSEWIPYTPSMEELGYYKCTFKNKDCKLSKTYCLCFKILEQDNI